MQSINERAVCAILNISGYDGRKLDKSQSRDVESRAGAAAGTARVTKSLIPRGELAGINEARGHLRTYHYDHTLPFVKGMQLVPCRALLDYERAMQNHMHAYNQACDLFAAQYRANFAVWLSNLGTMGRAADYPDPDHVRERFRVSLAIRPVGDVSTWLTDLSEDDRARLIERAKADEREIIEHAVQDCFGRIQKVVGHLETRMREIRKNGGKGKIYDSVIGNIRDLVSCLPPLNITNDPALDAAIDLCRAKLVPIDPEALRISETERDKAEKSASDILAAMSAYTGTTGS